MIAPELMVTCENQIPDEIADAIRAMPDSPSLAQPDIVSFQEQYANKLTAIAIMIASKRLGPAKAMVMNMASDIRNNRVIVLDNAAEASE